MILADVLVTLRAEAERIERLVPGLIWHLFGSVLCTPDTATDIDVLVLCETDAQVELVRHELRDACLCLPFHLFLLTRDEEAELGFIASEGCVQVCPHDAAKRYPA